MIYLDSAATTLQKPPQVAAAVTAAMSRAASPGRGGHMWGREAAHIAYTCRERAANLFHVPSPEQIVFTFNATHGLNIAIRTLVSPGSKVLISGYEHNAVTRTLRSIPDIEICIAECELFDRKGAVEAFRSELDKGVDTVICTHVSNVFGFVLPIDEIAVLCRACGTPLIIDAAQSAGCVPIDFTALGAAFIALPGHKGLYGPQGTGLLLCGKEALPLMYGGTGSLSVLQEMPDFLPDRLEAGTPNIPGIAGLCAGIDFVAAQGIEKIGRYEKDLIRRLGKQLSKYSGLNVFLSDDPAAQAGVLSVVPNHTDCEQAGEWLSQQGVAVRAGLQCAPFAHRSAGTQDSGTIRVSVSRFNTAREIDRAAYLLGRLSSRY